MSAAEDPSPVLCTSGRRTPVCMNGGSWERDCVVGGRLREASWMCQGTQLSIWKCGGYEVQNADLCALRVKVVITDDDDVQTGCEKGAEGSRALDF